MPRPLGRLGAVVTTALLVACSPAETEPVELPSAGAGPQEVVLAYLAAIDAEDRDAFAVLAEDGSVPEGWFGTGVAMSGIGSPVAGGDEGTRHADEDVVMVTATLTVRHGDGSLPEGEPFGWTYLLVQQDGRWVVFDQGQG